MTVVASVVLVVAVIAGLGIAWVGPRIARIGSGGERMCNALTTIADAHLHTLATHLPLVERSYGQCHPILSDSGWAGELLLGRVRSRWRSVDAATLNVA